MREVHARALEYDPVLDYLRDSAAAFGPRPCVTPEGAPIDPAQARDDRLLQSGQKLLDGVDVHREVVMSESLHGATRWLFGFLSDTERLDSPGDFRVFPGDHLSEFDRRQERRCDQ